MQTWMRRAEMREMLKRTCSWDAANCICLCAECLASSQMLFHCSRYFDEKYIPNHTDVDIYFAFLERKNKFRVSGTPHSLPSRMPNKPFFARIGAIVRFHLSPVCLVCICVQCGYSTKKVRSSARVLQHTFRCACIPLTIVVSILEQTACRKYDHT